MGGPAHVFHAPGHDHVGIPHLDGLGREHDRLEPGAADLVDRDALHLLGQAGLDGRLLGRILAVAQRQDLAHDGLVDLFRGKAGPLHGFRDHETTQGGGAHIAQTASEAS